ncbi:MAG: GNAT family N-acetyltransferase [Rickettsiella sp.]|nr:GNAT family N-acetyltransferase [Rickettsiella sp.]
MTIFLETERLLLKPTVLTDFDDLLALRSDPDVMKYLGNVQTKEEVKLFLEKTILYQAKHRIGFCSVFEKESHIFIGQAGLFHFHYDDKQPNIEIAYRLHKQFWGKGYATELVKALIVWGFEHLAIKKLVAVTDPSNIPSRTVLEKCGLDYIRVIKYGEKEVVYYEIYKTDSIKLVPYRSQWPKMAELEIKTLQEILPKKHLLDIQHVGSTAIPGIIAKPIIDILIAVDSLAAVKQITIEKLAVLGYQYWQDNPDTEKMFFVKGMPPFAEQRTHHVHIVEPGSKHWQEKMLFRDYLLTHSRSVTDYENLKKELAQKHRHDREQYTAAKAQFVNEILYKAKEETDLNKYPLNIIFLTGASGAGKTTLLKAFSQLYPMHSMAYLHFDSIGVPSEAEMIEVYGSASEWQKAMTYHWANNLLSHYKDKKLVILEGQVNLDFIVSAFQGFNFYQYQIVLVHCENAIRHKRLHQDRHQPELINDNMDNWADFLKKQAIDKKATILNTSSMSIEEMIEWLQKYIAVEYEIYAYQ